MDNFIPQDWLILLITSAVACGVLAFLHWFLLAKHTDLTSEEKLPRQLTMLGVNIVVVIVIVLALPVNESSRNQLLGLFGVLLSGVIAFSSTTIVSNLMAGVVLKLNRPFKTGDFIRCEGFEGRVTEKGLLDTEIQTRDRALVHIANSFLINNPVEVIRTSGTLISAEASIGYDVHHTIIEQHLQNAAVSAGLSDAFVHITQLGDFSISYKVSGMLEDTKSMLTTESKLYGAILDELHANNIEIMSPTIMAPRAVDPNYVFIAKEKIRVSEEATNQEATNQEAIVFDKADEAEALETQRKEVQTRIQELKDVLANLSDKTFDSKEMYVAEKTRIESEVALLEAKLGTLKSKELAD
jgi:small-conductance mechanosensitive channel